MSRDYKYRLGDLQLRIMQVLWKDGDGSVAAVLERLGDDLAYTTVATMLRKMENRGLVQHNEVDRKFLYEAAVSSEEVTSSMTSDLLDRLFAGKLSAAVSHLLESREVSMAELEDMEALIRQHKRNK